MRLAQCTVTKRLPRRLGDIRAISANLHMVVDMRAVLLQFLIYKRGCGFGRFGLHAGIDGDLLIVAVGVPG